MRANALRGVLLLLFVSVVLSGCGGASKKAHEAAAKAMYQPIEYENSAQQGPDIVVLPGEICSLSAQFLQKFKENNLRDFAEIELSKANFKVIEQADKQAFFQEIAVAANLGDASALRVFRGKGQMAPRYFVVVDVVKAEPVAWDVKGGDGELLGTLVELGFLIASKGDSKLGSAVGAAIKSVKHYEQKATWQIGLRYKVICAQTGEVVHTNEFTDQMDAVSEVTGVLGVSQGQTTNVTPDFITQRLVQRAVAEIDKEHKKGLVERAAADDPKKAKAKPDPRKEKALLKEYEQKVKETAEKRDKDEALKTIRAVDAGWMNLDHQAVIALSCPDMHETVLKTSASNIAFVQKTPNWRKILSFDHSSLNFEIVSYTPEKCVVREHGQSVAIANGKTTSYPVDLNYDLVKQDGAWKLCTYYQNMNGKIEKVY